MFFIVHCLGVVLVLFWKFSSRKLSSLRSIVRSSHSHVLQPAHYMYLTLTHCCSIFINTFFFSERNWLNLVKCISCHFAEKWIKWNNGSTTSHVWKSKTHFTSSSSSPQCLYYFCTTKLIWFSSKVKGWASVQQKKRKKKFSGSDACSGFMLRW